MDTIISDITHTAENNRYGKIIRSVGITGTELAQNRHKSIANQSVNFIEKKDGRMSRISLRPYFQ